MKIKKITKKKPTNILIANTALLSTGVSIKRLHNVVLCSPMKTYTTITQTIGRGMRLHKDKTVFRVFDIVDQMSPFMGQYNHRKKTSYEREQHPISESIIDLELYFKQEDW